jgi:hypothetical protein
VNTADCPGASVVVAPAHAPAGAVKDWQTGSVVSEPVPVWVSVTPTPDNVTVPVLAATNVYVTTCPTVVTDAAEADLTIVRPELVEAGIETADGSDVTGGPTGGVPDAVAESFSDPASRSAWVTVAVAVNVAD